jgi:hypothetical protein
MDAEIARRRAGAAGVESKSAKETLVGMYGAAK